jgi:hypothetical protein
MFGKPCLCPRCRYARTVALYFIPIWLAAFVPAVVTLGALALLRVPFILVIPLTIINFTAVGMVFFFAFLPVMRMKREGGSELELQPNT